MRVKLIGVGAGGNKGAITAVQNNVISINDNLLINSTLKDIPHDYEGKAIEFSNSYGGAGKERKISHDLCMNSLQDGTINLEEYLNVGQSNQCELCVIVTSTEGGTGSGAAPVLAKYVRDVLGIKVYVFAFTGFEEDVRGVKNTVEFFQEMQDNFIVGCIRLTKFLTQCNGNRLKAEVEADKEFSKKLSILMGNLLRDSDHNMDPTDLLKISTTEGYMIIEYSEIKDKIKNKEQFTKFLINMIDETKSLDLDNPSQKKMAVMININEGSTDYIDYLDILTERFGLAFEKFEHIQNEADMPEFFAFISAGNNMPTDEVTQIYNNYQSMVQNVNKAKDNFFSNVQKVSFSEDDDMFDLGSSKSSTINKDDFFKKSDNKSKFNNTRVKMTTVEDEY